MNQRLNPHVEAVMKLMLERGVEAAESYLATNVSPDVERAKAEYEAKQREEMAVRNIIQLSRLTALAQAPIAPAPGSASDGNHPLGEQQPLAELMGEASIPMNVRGRVLQIAAEVARNNNGIAKLDAVVDAVIKQGVDVGSTRPGTSIGNMLFKASPLWERVKPGVFRLVG